MKIHRFLTILAAYMGAFFMPASAQQVNYVGTPLIVDASQLSSPFADYLEGTNPGVLIDKDVRTYWHSDWHKRVPGDYHWIDVDLRKEVKGVLCLYMYRRDALNDHPTQVVVSGSADGENWHVVDTVAVPYSGVTEAWSAPWVIRDPVRHLRFTVIDCHGMGIGFRKIWHAAEMQVCLMGESTDYVNDVSSLCINEVQVANIDCFLDPSFNYGGWVELYNPTDHLISLAGVTLVHTDFDGVEKRYKLTNGHGMVPAGDYQVLWFDHNALDGNYGGSSHLNIPFKLDPEGGDLVLEGVDGTRGDCVHYLPAIARCSYARTTDGGDTWGWTSGATPGAANRSSTFATRRWDAPEVSVASGVINGRTTVNVKIPAGAKLRYTKDGTTPTATHGTTSVTGKVYVSETSVYRFVLYSDDALPSPVVTRTFIRQTGNYYLPILSVVTNPDNLYDDKIGVYTKGTNGIAGRGQNSPCNWNMDWERPVNMEYMVPDGDGVYHWALNQESDFKIAGGWSRGYGGGNGWPMKSSFRLKSGKVYEGLNSFDYLIYSGRKKHNKYKTLQVRNGGNDSYSRLIDPAIQQIVIRSGLYVDCQDWQPCHVFFNGRYLGMLNIRENNNKHYGESSYGIDTDEMDYFEMDPLEGYLQGEGDVEAMKEWLALSQQLAGNPTDSKLWRQICDIADVDEFCNYMAVECYIGCGDWLTNSNNLKGFRSKKDGGRFHIVMYDTDSAFGSDNMIGNLRSMLGGNDGRYREFGGKNPLVQIFFNMLKYAPFKKQFADAFSLVAGSVFSPERSKAIIDEMVRTTQPALAIEGNNPSGTGSWLTSVISDNGRRNMRMRNVRTLLSLPQPYSVKLSANIGEARLMVGGQEVPGRQFDGQLFPPINLTAKAPAGYVFTGWKAVSQAVSNTSLVSFKEAWNYYDRGSLDGRDWKSTDYDDGSWPRGRAPFGYGKVGTTAGAADYNTVLDYGGNASNKRPTYYFRKDFTLTSLPTEDECVHLYYYVDDGAIFYVNGVEVGTYNQVSGSKYNDYSITYESDVAAYDKLEIPASVLRAGTNTVAVEVHNNSATSSDIFFDARLVRVTASSSILSEDETFCLSENHPNGTYSLTACFEPVGDSLAMMAVGASPLRINEVSAGNDIYVDEHFKHGDWLEVYNTTGHDIDMAGMYLSDNRSNPLKYQIGSDGGTSSTVVPAHGHRIIWCDKLQPVSQLHAPFKLSNADGASISLQAADGTWTDEMVYMEQNQWQTFGRYPDGGNYTALLNQPTIEWSNMLGTYDFTADSIFWQDNDISITLALAKGWNWMSHNLQQPVHSSRFTPRALCIRSQETNAHPDEDGEWTGLMPSVLPAQGYKLRMAVATDIVLRGSLYDTEQPVSVREGWNWIGVPLYNVTVLDTALSDYVPTEGDAIVGQEGFSTFEDGSWKGTLTALSPGRGYLLKSGLTQDFRWTALSKPQSARKRYAPVAPLSEGTLWGADTHAWPDVMNVVATLQIDGEPVTEGDFQVAAFSGDDCRGLGILQDGQLFFTLYGQGGETLTFRLMDTGGDVYTLQQSLSLQSQTIVGSRRAPYLLTLSTTGLHQPTVVSAKPVSVSYYNASGVKISAPGRGVTLQQTTYANGQIIVKKILR